MSTTICALSTPYGRGGIAVVRVSGSKALEITSKIFMSKKPLGQAASHTVTFGRIVDGEIQLDQALVTVFRSPNSFTGEDVCEISCHGGTVVVNKIIDLLIEKGCEMAQPGEFTKRAFMNGKLSLTEAEAVKDVIDARTDGALWAAVNRLEGGITGPICEMREKLLHLLAAIQVASDFPEEDVEDFSGSDLYADLDKIYDELGKLKNSARRGEALREGITCAICGIPNTGKSSLLNALYEREKAIVTDLAGTTRDVVEAWIDLEGIPVKLGDTAGIRESGDRVEKIGVEMSLDYIRQADICLFVTEAGRTLTPDEEEILSSIKCPIIKIANKIDKNNDIQNNYIGISAKENIGIDKIKEEIIMTLGLMATGGSVIANRRQLQAVVRAMEAVGRAKNSVENGFYSDLAAIDVREAVEALGEAEGLSVNQETVNKIFEEFCLGK